MEDINKFKELLEEYSKVSNGGYYHDILKIEQKLIKMYEKEIKEKEFYENKYNELYDRL